VKTLSDYIYYEEPAGVIYCGDCLEILPLIPEGSVDLVVTDPPYGINKDKWDNPIVTTTVVIPALIKCDNILSDSGSLWYSHMVYSTTCQIHSKVESKTSLKHLQFITIDKGMGSVAGRTSENLRTFPRATEYLLWYSHEDPTGAEWLSEEMAKRNPMAIYLRSEIERSGKSRKEIAALFPSKTGGFTGCVSNWLLGYNFPLKEQYETIKYYLNGEYLRREYEELRREYEYLRREYEELRREYEELRRPFNLPFGVTDVWKYSFNDSNSGHPTEKVLGIISRIIAACSNRPDIILDPFLGSGTTAVAAKQLGRKFIGIEISEKYCEIAKQRLAQEELF